MSQPRQFKRLIVYGGSFDPPHRGHVALPFEAARLIGADGVMYVPAGQPPHKTSRVLTPAHHRLNMLRLALRERGDAIINTWEIEQPAGTPNYTVDTLEHLRMELGDAVELRLLIGADMAMIFDQWRRPDKIARLAEPLVMLRPPADVEQLLSRFPAGVRDLWRKRVIITSQLDISSTQLRHQLAYGHQIAPPDAISPDVLSYIRENRLYSVESM